MNCQQSLEVILVIVAAVPATYTLTALVILWLTRGIEQ